MWRQDIPGYSGMLPCPETNGQRGRDQSHNPIILRGQSYGWDSYCQMSERLSTKMTA